MSPTFSIILPTYNRAYILWKTIQSIQNQEYNDWELIIVDDGSTDDTKKLVAEFQRDTRIQYIYQENKRPPAARNNGMEHTTGKIITYVDSDDMPYPKYLSVALDFFEKHPDKMFAIPNYNRRLELYDENHKLVDFTRSSSAQKETITIQDYYDWNVKPCGTGIFHRSEVLDTNIRWDTGCQALEDFDFILQLGHHYPDGFLYIPFALFQYSQRYGGDGICSNATYLTWSQEFEKIYEKHKDDPLMKKPEIYLERIEKYKKLHEDVQKGKVKPLVHTYFPEHFKE